MSLAIPQYPASRPVEISDRKLIQELFEKLQPTISEFSFANLFLFSNIHHYRLSIANNSLTVFGCGYDGQPYFLQPLSGDRGETAKKLLDDGNTLYGADEQFIAEHLSSGDFTPYADRDNDDYLYLRSDLAELPGKLFHKKKNRINYFASRHNYNVEPYGKNHLESSVTLLGEWERAHRQDLNRSISADIAATRMGLELADEIGLSGVVVLTDRGVSAFSLGEKLNDTTFVCHFEKADPFLEGASQLVNREFCRFLPTACIYVNREQDLGESGLKAAKNSYHPAGMIRKYRVRRSS